MNKIRIKKENVLYMEQTDVIKIILTSISRKTNKNNFLLCDKNAGIVEDSTYYYVTLSKKEIM